MSDIIHSHVILYKVTSAPQWMNNTTQTTRTGLQKKKNLKENKVQQTF